MQEVRLGGGAQVGELRGEGEDVRREVEVEG